MKKKAKLLTRVFFPKSYVWWRSGGLCRNCSCNPGNCHEEHLQLFSTWTSCWWMSQWRRASSSGCSLRAMCSPLLELIFMLLTLFSKFLVKPSCFSGCKETKVVVFPMLTIGNPNPESLTDPVMVITVRTTEASAALQPEGFYSSSC